MTYATLSERPETVWLTTEEVATRIGMQAQTVRKWRSRGTLGPKSYKIGGAVKYKQSDVDAWLEQNSRVSE